MLRRYVRKISSSIYKNTKLNLHSKTEHEVRSLILKETKASRNHLTPEISLNLILPECQLWKASSHPFQADPFWGFYWPGGQSLSRFILDNGNIFHKKNILDFGCGCGACGLSARKVKARSVLLNDIDDVALLAAKLNFAENDLQVDSLCSKNMIGDACNGIDTVLVGDMFYDSDFAEDVMNWLMYLSEKGKDVFIGDPGRFALSSYRQKANLKCLGRYKLLPGTILENNGFPDGFVWKICQ